MIEEYGVEEYLLDIQEDLQNKEYRSKPVKRVYIPKPDGKQRPLGIPTIRDRIVQQACKIVIEPIFEANFLDNLFELADGSIALVDYESDYEKQDKVKYLNYVAGIVNRYLQAKKDCPKIHMVVIYTGDIVREQVSADYDIGAVKMNLETAFLSELDSREIYNQLRDKIEKNQMLSDEELMEFIILPLAYRTKEEKQEKVRETVGLAVKIRDKKQ